MLSHSTCLHSKPDSALALSMTSCYQEEKGNSGRPLEALIHLVEFPSLFRPQVKTCPAEPSVLSCSALGPSTERARVKSLYCAISTKTACQMKKRKNKKDIRPNLDQKFKTKCTLSPTEHRMPPTAHKQLVDCPIIGLLHSQLGLHQHSQNNLHIACIPSEILLVSQIANLANADKKFNNTCPVFFLAKDKHIQTPSQDP